MERVILEKRFDKFEKFVESCDFEKFFYRILLEHNDEWFEICSINGLEKTLNNKLKFIFQYLESRGNRIFSNKNNSFLHTEKWKFKNFIFEKEYLINKKLKYKIENCFDKKIVLEI